MKILLISDLFYPNNVIGALRPTKIAGKLTECGHTVDVFTRYRVTPEDLAEKKLCANLYGFAEYSCPVNRKSSGKKHSALYRYLYNLYRTTMSLVNAQKVVKKLQTALKENPALGESEYDAVFSSFGPLPSLLCGMYYKKTHPECRWICDFRDPVVVQYIHPLLRPYYRHLEKKACKMADAIIAVSNGYLDRICRGKFQEKAYMLPNGYDLKDTAFLEQNAPKTGPLELTYVGGLYGGDRDLSPLFSAIRELIDAGEITREDIRVCYAGKEFSVLTEQAGRYALQEIIQDEGLLSREDCLKLQSRADLLLIATWNDRNEYGVFPGKMLEYMLIGKPIVSLTCGSLPNGEITQVIKEGEFGIAYESACHQTDFSRLKEYILSCCHQKKEQGTVFFAPKQAVLDRYNYENIIKRLEEILHG